MKPLELEAHQLSQILSEEGSVLLDIREEYEYEDDHLDSLHIPMAEVRSKIPELSKYKSIVVCCKSGNRALAVSHLLTKSLNGTKIAYLKGGMVAYRQVYATD